MANNCIVRKFKTVIEDSSLDYFGFYKGYVDTTDAVGNANLVFFGNPTGVRIVSNGSFTDGTKEITSPSDAKAVAPNTQLTLIIPKYSCIPDLNNRYLTANEAKSTISFNMDDVGFVEIENVNGVNIKLLENSTPFRGDVTNVIKLYTQNTLKTINSNAFVEVTGNLENAFIGMTVLTSISMAGTSVSGRIGTLIKNMIQSNKAAFKGRSNSLSINLGLTNCTFEEFFPEIVSFSLGFTGTSTVNIIRKGSTIGTYDIDTNTFSINS